MYIQSKLKSRNSLSSKDSRLLEQLYRWQLARNLGETHNRRNSIQTDSSRREQLINWQQIAGTAYIVDSRLA